MAEEPASEIRLFRFGRLPDPLAPTPWERVGGFRFDDPERQFRVLYAAEQRIACLVEKLASLRPPPDASSDELARVFGEMEDGDEQGPPPPTPGIIGYSMLLTQAFGELSLPRDQPHLDLRDHAAREMIRSALTLPDLDMSDLVSRGYELTRQIA